MFCCSQTMGGLMDLRLDGKRVAAVGYDFYSEVCGFVSWTGVWRVDVLVSGRKSRLG